MTFGSEIVESFYDYDTHMIGPYYLPVDIHYDTESCQGNAFSVYRLYEVLNDDEKALAVFNVNNYCFCVVRKDHIRMIPYSYSDHMNLPAWDITPFIQKDTYKHVGWVKTYQKCKATYTWPWKLIQNVNTGEVWSCVEKIKGTPLENPPLSLYKSLIDTPYKGVYFDLEQNKPVFIN